MLVTGVAAVVFGFETLDGTKDGFPASGYFFFGAIALLTAGLDIRVLVNRGVAGLQRIVRH